MYTHARISVNRKAKYVNEQMLIVTSGAVCSAVISTWKNFFSTEKENLRKCHTCAYSII